VTLRNLRRPRKVVVLVPGRERLGLSDREVASQLRPRTGLVTALGALGFTPPHRRDDPAVTGPSTPTRRNEVSP
jgi:hypothetical protein